MKKIIIFFVIQCSILFGGQVWRADQIPDVYGTDSIKVRGEVVNATPIYKVTFESDDKIPQLVATGRLKVGFNGTLNSSYDDTKAIYPTSISKYTPKELYPIENIQISTKTEGSKSYKYLEIDVATGYSFSENYFSVLIQPQVFLFDSSSSGSTYNLNSKTDDIRVKMLSGQGFTTVIQNNIVNNNLILEYFVFFTGASAIPSSSSSRFRPADGIHSGSVKDKKTGLEWLKRANYNDIHGTDVYDQKLTMVHNLCNMSFAGYSDWRMPTTNELVQFFTVTSLENSERHDKFNNLFANREYWTQTQSTDETIYYCVNMGENGSLAVIPTIVLPPDRYYECYFWAVRGTER